MVYFIDDTNKSYFSKDTDSAAVTRSGCPQCIGLPECVVVSPQRNSRTGCVRCRNGSSVTPPSRSVSRRRPSVERGRCARLACSHPLLSSPNEPDGSVLSRGRCTPVSRGRGGLSGERERLLDGGEGRRTSNAALSGGGQYSDGRGMVWYGMVEEGRGGKGRTGEGREGEGKQGERRGERWGEWFGEKGL